jgi:hypothetical protein
MAAGEKEPEAGFVDPASDTGGRSSGHERERYRDFTTSLGGPVVRDRLWFLGSYQYQRDYEQPAGRRSGIPPDLRAEQGVAHIHLAPEGVHATHADLPPGVLREPDAGDGRYACRSDHNPSAPNMTFGHFTHMLTPATLWETRVGRYVLDWTMDPSTGDRSTPNRLDRITNVSSGNVNQLGQLLLRRRDVLHEPLRLA